MSRPARAAQTLSWRADQLREAIGAGSGELTPSRVAAALRVIDKVAQRSALAAGRTVVALAGATGSGKSSLFNILVGEDVSQVGATRPTTAETTAAVWGQDESGDLLDWLGVARRHHVGSGDEALDGLVLLDLPDVDSRATAHRVEADRVLERVDVFVWVTDPQKYADSRLHDDYLAALRDHDTVMLVVLNQVDRLPDADTVEQVRADLARLVREDGTGEVRVLATSAVRGTGVPELRAALAAVVAARTAAQERLVGDLRGSARGLLEDVAPTEPRIGAPAQDALVQALARAAGVPVVLDAVHRDYLRRARANAGWPFTRWLARLRPDPLRRLRLGDDRAGDSGISPTDVLVVLGRSSLPAATPAARSAVALASARLAEQAGEGLPARWGEAVSAAASPRDTDLADSLDQAVMGTSLRVRDPLWWLVANAVQTVLAVVAIAGLLWLAVLAGLGFLQIPVEAPVWGPLPIPVLLLAGGVLLGLLLAVVLRSAARVGAGRRRRVVEGRLRAAITEVAQERVRRPVDGVLERHRQTRDQLTSAAS